MRTECHRDAAAQRTGQVSSEQQEDTGHRTQETGDRRQDTGESTSNVTRETNSSIRSLYPAERPKYKEPGLDALVKTVYHLVKINSCINK